MSPSIQLAPGTIFADQFRVLSTLGHGGMGAVYAVEQWRTGHRRALKVMQPSLVDDVRMRARFLQEATIGSLIRSDHIAHVVDAGIEAHTGTPWIAMELLVGGDLATVLGARGTLPAEEVQEIFAQLCHAIDAAHEAGVIHRDLKPPNIFLAESRREGSPFTVKVLDFGIAKLVAEAGIMARGWLGGHHTQTVGTPAWMAPEQAETGVPITPAADIWALGLLAFSMLTGRSFWRSVGHTDPGGVRVLREVVFDPIPPASVRAATLGCGPLPPGFDGWFARAVARQPSSRFARARDARIAFDQIFGPPLRSTPAIRLPLNSRPPPSGSPSGPPIPEDVITNPIPRAGEKRVMVVDDNPADQLILGHHLSHGGYTVVCADSGEQALARIAEHVPAVVLLDFFLPDIDAPEVLRRLRAKEATRDLPVILLTGTDLAAHVAAGFQAGANDYLMKPVDGNRLRERIAAAVETREAARRARTVSSLERRHGQLVADLQQAREEQEAPLATLPATWDDFWAIGGMVPAGLVGGDLATVYESADGARVIAVIDVSGHGPAAAMVGAGVRSALGVLLRSHGPAEALSMLNDELASQPAPRHACVALLKFEGMRVSVVNAGLPAVVIIRDGLPHAAVEGSGLPPGLLAGQTYEIKEFQLLAGDRVAAVTDGLLEAASDPLPVLAALGAFDRHEWTGTERPVEVAMRMRTVLGHADKPDDATFVMVGVGPRPRA